MNTPAQTTRTRARVWIPVACVACVAGMVGLAYAAVPLYRIFCQVTGFGGTTQAATEGSDVVLDKDITVRFDANISRDMAWRFVPVQRQMTLRIGETGLAFFKASNPTSKTLTGTATFNVTPPQAGAYFNKLECFCFTEQTLEPGGEVEMPVSFFVDPAMVDDPELDGVKTITLSYTFFPVAKSTASVAKTGTTAGAAPAQVN